MFPSYTLLLGTAGNSTGPAHSDLLASADAVERCWASAMYPWEMVMPQSRPWAPHEVQQHLVGDTDWGHVKFKKVDPSRWIPHVHQVLFWCGTAQTGQGSRARYYAQRWGEGQAASSWNRSSWGEGQAASSWNWSTPQLRPEDSAVAAPADYEFKCEQTYQ